MQNIQTFITKHFTKITFLTAGIFFIIAASVFAFTKTPRIKKITSETVVTHVVVTPTVSPTVAYTAQAQQSISTPAVTSIQAVNPTPTPTPAPQQQSSTNKATLQISEPDGTFSYSVDFSGSSNPCSLLNNAKGAGDIRSVTISHYDAPLNSDYVKEINGYVNGWNFSLNGTQEPTGCSNYNVTNGDTVSWKFSQ